MSLTAGTRLGSYEILGLIGAGGMGEVHRARDTRLKRDVAIKVLPDAFARDPDRLARFQREAELLATLNHPNIAAIYGFEGGSGEAGDGVHALVLELVEGPTLADRLSAGALPLDEAVNIAKQIADALRAAHDKGVIHRDLKPANIKITPNGNVKVLDFGLAKMRETEQHTSSLTMSPTLSVQATQAGMILGTAAYMSPEQARGKPADQRSDIWAFGCVLYEMLTGRRVFTAGETVSDAVAAILTQAPDWSALPPRIPQAIRRLLHRCLDRNPDRRVHHIADARLELEEPELVDPREASPAVVAAPRWVRLVPWALTLAALGVAAWLLWQRPTSSSARTLPVMRLEMNLPNGVEMFAGASRPMAISADGSRVAFIGVTGGIRYVYVRGLDQFDAVAVKGSDNAMACVFSPDGRSIALVTSAGVLKSISLADGLVATLAPDATFINGVAWSVDGSIIFVRNRTLWQLPQSGDAKQLTTLEGDRPDTLHSWPTVAPDGKTIVFSVTSGNETRIDALVLATGERRTVMERGTMPLATAEGQLMFVRDGELLVAPFDANRLIATGPAIRAIDNLPASSTGTPTVDVSRAGTIVYAPTTAVSRLVWVSRQGVEQALNAEPRSYANPRLSPDGTRLVVQAGDFWIQDLARSTFTRLTSRTTTSNGFPEWTPDGRRVVFRTANGLRVQDAEGSGDAQAIAGTTEFDYPSAITPDGETLLFMRSAQGTSFDVFTLPLRDPATATPIIQTTAYEGGARLSPDNRWLIYVSNESGQNEIYLRQFHGSDRRWQVSTQGGTQAMWNPNGKEIFYRSADKMMAVGISTTPEVVLSRPQMVFEQRYAFGAGITIPNYDVSHDGQRFVMIKDEATAGRLNLVVNWLPTLARREAANH